MIDRMEETLRQLAPDDIDALERRVGLRLPDDYRVFLLKYNGGRPVPSGFPIEGLANNPFGAIHFFFGVEDPLEGYNIGWHRNVTPGRLPDNLLPIACDHCGDLICLSLYGDDAGAVLFWDWHTEPPEPSYDNVFRIAGSFSEFIDSLREIRHENGTEEK
jgi:hypothetical protein